MGASRALLALWQAGYISVAASRAWQAQVLAWQWLVVTKATRAAHNETKAALGSRPASSGGGIGSGPLDLRVAAGGAGGAGIVAVVEVIRAGVAAVALVCRYGGMPGKARKAGANKVMY